MRAMCLFNRDLVNWSVSGLRLCDSLTERGRTRLS